MSGRQAQEEETVRLELTRAQYDMLDYIFRGSATERTLDALTVALSIDRLEATNRITMLGRQLASVSTVTSGQLSPAERWIWLTQFALAVERGLTGPFAATDAGRAVLEFRSTNGPAGWTDADEHRELGAMLREVRTWR